MDLKETEPTISLHGLGFVQVKLGAKQRLHVWHPDLPRRRCFEHSQVHDHRFSFESHVLVGSMENTKYEALLVPETRLIRFAGDEATHMSYRHEGPRTRFGNRPWTPAGERRVRADHHETLKAGDVYYMSAFHFHSTRALGDGKVVTLMRKLTEDDRRGATSLCSLGVEPDVDFDRLQAPPALLWGFVVDALGDVDSAGVMRKGRLVDVLDRGLR